jgi:hypothetical protein
MIAAVAFAKAWVLAHYVAILGVSAYAVLEWVLPRTKLFKADSGLELLANAGKKILLDKIPIVGRLVAFLATQEATPAAEGAAPRAGGQAGKTDLLLMIGFGLARSARHGGCATTASPAGASTAQKLQDDMAAAKQIAVDVEAKCGSMYVPIVPAIASALMTASTAPGAMGIILACIEAAPAVYTDAQALVCAIKVVAEDLKALKPGPVGQKAAQLGAEIAAFNELTPELGALDVNEPPNICVLEEPRPAP